MINLKHSDIFIDFHISETILKTTETTFNHNHDFYEFFIVTHGILKHKMNGSVFLLNADTLSIIYPTDQHCFQKYGAKDVHFINLAIPSVLFKKVLGLYQKFTSTSTPSFQGSFVELPSDISQSLLAKIYYLHNDLFHLNGCMKNEHLITIILDALVSLNNIDSTHVNPPFWLLNACKQMQRRENYLLGLGRFIELSTKSQEHLTRMMRKYYATTPTRYINSIKLSHARYLLSTTSLNILDIIYESGFENVSYFNHLFKKEFKTTPSQFRNLNNQVINPKNNNSL